MGGILILTTQFVIFAVILTSYLWRRHCRNREALVAAPLAKTARSQLPWVSARLRAMARSMHAITPRLGSRGGVYGVNRHRTS